MRIQRDRVREIALKRIQKLFNLARKERSKQYAIRYIKLAREIARKTQTRIPKELKRGFCKKCNMPFSSRTKVRIKNKILIYTCNNCGEKRRFKIKNN